MKTCKTCGIPLIVGRDQKWNPDGTITVSNDSSFRMGIMELTVLLGTVKKLEEVVGPPIHNMFMEASRKHTRRYVDNLIKGPLGFVVRKTKAGSKKAYTTLLDTTLALGFGKVDFQLYEHKERLKGIIRNPYYLPLFIGDVRGAFESIEGLPSKAEWDEKEGEAMVEISRRKGESLLDDRFGVYEENRVPGEVEYERCERCGLPDVVARFRWDLDDGIITDTKTGNRVIIMGLNDLNGVFKELEDAIGDMVPKAIFEMNREYGRVQVAKGWVDGFVDFARDQRVMGMANISVDVGKEKVVFDIRNPFNKDYVVGRCLGVYEGLERMEAEPRTKETPGSIRIALARGRIP